MSLQASLAQSTAATVAVSADPRVASQPRGGNDPYPLLVVTRGLLSPRALAALRADSRIELQWQQADFAHSKSGIEPGALLVVAESEPLSALAYAAMCGLGGPIVMAISAEHASDRGDLLAAGALACLTLPLCSESVDELVGLLVSQASTRRAPASARVSIDSSSLTMGYRGSAVRLTRREFALMHCLVERHGTAVAAEELLNIAWADNASARASRRILELYVHQLRKKLGTLGLPGALKTVRGIGYALG